MMECQMKISGFGIVLAIGMFLAGYATPYIQAYVRERDLDRAMDAMFDRDRQEEAAKYQLSLDASWHEIKIAKSRAKEAAYEEDRKKAARDVGLPENASQQEISKETDRLNIITRFSLPSATTSSEAEFIDYVSKRRSYLTSAVGLDYAATWNEVLSLEETKRKQVAVLLGFEESASLEKIGDDLDRRYDSRLEK